MAEDFVRDFFISYTGDDQPWAEWIGLELEKVGYSTLLQAWDFVPGTDWVARMQRASTDAHRTIAVLSPSYFTSQFGEAEWRAVFARDPSGEEGLLIPVRVRPCQPPGLLVSRVYIDLVDQEVAAAQRLLVDGVRTAGSRPTVVEFPGSPDPPPDSDKRAGFPGARRAAGPVTDRAPDRRLDSSAMATERDGDRTTKHSPWEWLNHQREPLRELLGEHRDLIGHAAAQELLRAKLDQPETAELILLSGAAGSGKSSILEWLNDIAGSRIVNASTHLAAHSPPQVENGVEIRRLLHQLRQDVSAAGDHPVLVFDDADVHLGREGFTLFVRDAIARLDIGTLVVSTKAPLRPELFPIPVSTVTLDRRSATSMELDRLLDRVLAAAGEEVDAFSPDLRRNLYDMSEQTPNFRGVEYVIEMLLAHHQWTDAVTEPVVLRHLLDADVHARHLGLPAVGSVKGPLLSFRRKDKSELLGELLLRRFGTPQSLADVARQRMNPFDVADFLGYAADVSCWDALTALGYAYSPPDLVRGLLEPEEIHQELESLRVEDAARAPSDPGREAHQLVRALGFTFVDTPQGLDFYKRAIRDSWSLIEDPRKASDIVTGAGSAVIRHVESALGDLLHFWSTYLFESMRKLVMAYGLEQGPGAAPMDVWHLTTADMVLLLRFINRAARSDESAFMHLFPEGDRPVSGALLNACDIFMQARNAFVRVPSPVVSSAAESRLRRLSHTLAEAGAAVLDRAGQGAFPAAITLKAIVFDEYGRKVYHAVDSDDHEVRFAFTDDEDRPEVIIPAELLMLPVRAMSVNPHLVARSGAVRPVLFDRAEAYEAASATQRQQGRRLLELIDLGAEDEVIDVGCGTGSLALGLAGRVRSVHGIDRSPDMVRYAAHVADAGGVDNITFEVADLLELDADEVFDVVLSNSTMHWILPPERAYRQLFRLLRHGGRLAVHQGGEGNYRGLHRHVVELIRDEGLMSFFTSWRYPVYYPSPHEYRDLLEQTGFVNVDVQPIEPDGRQYPDLVGDFAEAGLLPYLDRLPEAQRDSFRNAFVDSAKSLKPGPHNCRLYAVAVRS